MRMSVFRAQWLWATALWCWLLLGGVARAQQAGNVDPSFGGSLGLLGQVEVVAAQADGKILVGGEFPGGIARLNTDGSVDTSFYSGTIAYYVRTITVQGDGKILISGVVQFPETISGGRVVYVGYTGVARLNADGSVDSSFDLATGANGPISSVALQADGKIIVGGEFTSYKSVTRLGLARLNADGSVDTNFVPGYQAGYMTGSISSSLNALAVQSDGKVIITGYLFNGDGSSLGGIARVNPDGSVDGGFNPPGIDYTGQPRRVAVQADGKIVFDTETGGLGRINGDGSLDGTFDSATATGFTGLVSSIVVQANGGIVVAGGFTQVDGAARSGIARLNADGTVDTGFNPGTGATAGVYFGSSVSSAFLQADGRIVIGGNFTRFNGVLSNSVARLNTDGSLDTTLSADTAPGPDAAPTVIAAQSDGKVIIGGIFSGVSGTARNGIARLNADGGLDLNFDPDTGASGSVNAIVVQSDGKIVIGGRSRPSVARRATTSRGSTPMAAWTPLSIRVRGRTTPSMGWPCRTTAKSSSAASSSRSEASAATASRG